MIRKMKRLIIIGAVLILGSCSSKTEKQDQNNDSVYVKTFKVSSDMDTAKIK